MNDQTLDRVFVYGTLQDDETVRRITGRTFPKVKGRLDGYRRMVPTPGFPYPYAIAQEGAFLAGSLLVGVDPASLLRLDAYEGGFYVRRRVMAATDGGQCEAWLYEGSSSR